MTSFIPLSSCFFSTHFFLVRGTAIPTIVLIRSKNARRKNFAGLFIDRVVLLWLRQAWNFADNPYDNLRYGELVQFHGMACMERFQMNRSSSHLESFLLDVFLILWIQKSSLNDQFLSHYWGFVKKYSDNSRVMMNDTNPNFSHYFLKEIL